jgi:exonuclease III
MSIYYQNSRGLKTKTKGFYNNLLNSEHSIICLTETWLQDSISSNELFDNRYTVIRADRNLKTTHKSDGGGVLIALLKSCFKNIYTNTSWLTPSVEMASVSVTLQNNELLHIFCLYLEPKYSYTKLELLLTNLEKICIANPNDRFLIVGDWNIPEFVIYN